VLQSQRAFAHFVSAMAHNHDDCFNAALLEIVETAFDNGLVAEREERLERAHAP
jgi:hypothetical protein